MASHVSLQDFNTGGWTAEQGSTDLTFKNVNVAHGGEFFVDSATNVSVIGGVVDGAGQYWSNGNQVKTMSTTAPIPSGILIDGITIKNFRRDPTSSDHVDCLHIMSGNGITVRDSHFSNCEAFDILTTMFIGATPTNVLIENNFLSCCGSGYYSVDLGGGHGEQYHNVTVRNNSSDKDMTVGTENTLANVAFYNNDVPGIGGCDRSGVTADYNVLFDASTKCGSHDLLVPSGFASATDFHLVAGAKAINAALASQSPATDIDGQTRPQGCRAGHRRGRGRVSHRAACADATPHPAGSRQCAGGRRTAMMLLVSPATRSRWISASGNRRFICRTDSRLISQKCPRGMKPNENRRLSALRARTGRNWTSGSCQCGSIGNQ